MREGWGLDEVGGLVEEAAEGGGGGGVRRGGGSGAGHGGGGGGVSGLRAGRGYGGGAVAQDAGLAEHEVLEGGGGQEEGQPGGGALGGGVGEEGRVAALDLLPDLEDELGEGIEAEQVTGAQVAEDLADGVLDALHDNSPAAVEQPPAEGQVLTVGLEVAAIVGGSLVGLVRVVAVVIAAVFTAVVVVLEVDG